jgi:hypothetical protein
MVAFRPSQTTLGSMALAVIAVVAVAAQSEAITVQVDYSYDTNNFFDTQGKKDAIQAAANRFSNIITSSLLAVDASYGNDWRVGFSHPGTGVYYQISTAASSGVDSLAGAGVADEYNSSFALPTDTWILFAGGRSLGGSAGVGGTGTGLNWSSVLDDPSGPHRRNLGVEGLPVWGGSLSFDNTRNWHFDPNTAASGGDVDFYSIATHEVGHVLGLSTSWSDFTDNVAGDIFSGPNAVAAYNSDNGTSETGLSLVGGGNNHWGDGAYDSRIFAQGDPNYVGTVGAGGLQDLLMEPMANFRPGVRRFEVTNVEVGALQDIGWSIVTMPTDQTLQVRWGKETISTGEVVWSDPVTVNCLVDGGSDDFTDAEDVATHISDIPEGSWGIYSIDLQDGSSTEEKTLSADTRNLTSEAVITLEGFVNGADGELLNQNDNADIRNLVEFIDVNGNFPDTTILRSMGGAHEQGFNSVIDGEPVYNLEDILAGSIGGVENPAPGILVYDQTVWGKAGYPDLGNGWLSGGEACYSPSGQEFQINLSLNQHAPEPSSLTLLLIGAVSLLCFMGRRR